MEADMFSFWLSKQRAHILSNQTTAAAAHMDRLDSGDLLSVMYHGDDIQAVTALRLLRVRFEDEMNAHEELSRMQW